MTVQEIILKHSSMQLKRVVVTGLGALTPIGNNIEEYWEGLKTGKSGSAPITYYDTEKFKVKFACELKNYNRRIFLIEKRPENWTDLHNMHWFLPMKPL